ncbi:MAG: MutS-related protein, partial [Spirochaetota bacterium]
MTLSLLVPPGAESSQRFRLSDSAVHDLELRTIAAGMTHRGVSEEAVLRVLTELPQSPQEIEYRQETARSLWANPELCDELENVVRTMQELTVFSRSGKETDRPLLEAVWRLGELELYVELVRSLRLLLDRTEGLSSGLRALRDELRRRENDPAFSELSRELPELRSGIKMHQSVTIGVNLDDKLRPVEAALLGINDKKYHEGHFLNGFLRKATGDPYTTKTPLSRSPGTEAILGGAVERLPLAPLFEELDAVLRSMLRPLARRLRSYVSVNTEIFRRIYPEIAFFLGATGFSRSMRAIGYPISFPAIVDSDRRLTEFRGLYNLRLASHWTGKDGARRMVRNDVAFTDAARIFVLTGPNGGGKTTFTQAVGIATVLAQAGLAIPARSGSVAPVDAVYTHFPAEEEFDDELGRFEDEAQRISALFDLVTPSSMVLLNEPLAGTGPREAERIATSVLTGLCLAGVRGVFTTHFHEVARAATEINRERVPERGESLLGTLNAGIRYEHGRAERTYEIASGPPTGSSFAEDVARKYRIDAESLGRRIRGRGITSDRDL